MSDRTDEDLGPQEIIDDLQADLAAATAAREQAEKWQWRFSDKLIQDEKCHDWGELFAEVVKLASRAEISEADAETKGEKLADGEAIAMLRQITANADVGDDALLYAGSATWDDWRNHVPIAVRMVWKDLSEETRRAVWSTCFAVTGWKSPPPPASEPLSRSRLKREAVQRGEELPSFAPAEASEPTEVERKETPWDRACGWYDEEEIHRAIHEIRHYGPGESKAIPRDVFSREFSKWLTHQYRLAMSKGIQLGRGDSVIDSATAELRKENERLEGERDAAIAEIQAADEMEKRLRELMQRAESQPTAKGEELERLRKALSREQRDCLKQIRERDYAQVRLDCIASMALGEEINWSDHHSKWEEAADEIAKMVQERESHRKRAEGDQDVSGVPAVQNDDGVSLEKIERSQVQVFGGPAPKTWDDYEQGCHATFGGGYRTEEEREIFRHGMSTVFNMLRREFKPAAEARRIVEGK